MFFSSFPHSLDPFWIGSPSEVDWGHYLLPFKIWGVLFVLSFETRCLLPQVDLELSIADDLELLTLLLQPPKFCDYRLCHHTVFLQ